MDVANLPGTKSAMIGEAQRYPESGVRYTPPEATPEVAAATGPTPRPQGAPVVTNAPRLEADNGMADLRRANEAGVRDRMRPAEAGPNSEQHIGNLEDQLLRGEMNGNYPAGTMMGIRAEAQRLQLSPEQYVAALQRGLGGQPPPPQSIVAKPTGTPTNSVDSQVKVPDSSSASEAAQPMAREEKLALQRVATVPLVTEDDFNVARKTQAEWESVKALAAGRVDVAAKTSLPSRNNGAIARPDAALAAMAVQKNPPASVEEVIQKIGPKVEGLVRPSKLPDDEAPNGRRVASESGDRPRA